MYEKAQTAANSEESVNKLGALNQKAKTKDAPKTSTKS